MAWEIVTTPRLPQGNYDMALVFSRKAVELAPTAASYVNTLALAEYRSGHWAESFAAAQKSMAMNGGADPSDRFFLALAHGRNGEKAEARKWFDKAVALTKENDPTNPELLQFWTEAAQQLGQSGPPAPGPKAAEAPSTKAAK